MASGSVWGIDIGQCALKALRCRAHDDPKKIVAEAFDYIEYPKILSQPGSDPAELIKDALKQFLSRNVVVGDRVAISVSGQAGLARFIKLPPVETKKIPDIVRYEARQQIPFDLNDVVWDYQRMGGGSVEEGFALETEIGLFAMKRDAVFRALEPFLRLDIEVDIVQLTPLVLYNLVLFDQLGDLPPADEYDPDNPPESVVIVSMGTDATDLVITNGYRVWQRSIPIGGNHFTKALTRELKLTFAKAEHLKRNATAAADPKAVFQAMKPVFNDLLTELQRSIGYFCNLDRAAKIGRVVALGNAMRLPGLRRYLSQSLGFEIEKMEAYRNLIGPQVVAAPTFQENLLSFGVTYGLALQGLGKSGVHTNLLPHEIINDRLIRRKKPWAVAAAAAIVLGCGVSFAAYSLALAKVDTGAWNSSQGEAKGLVEKANRLQSEADQAKATFKATDEIGQHLTGNLEGRLRWLELLKAVNACMPYDPVRNADDPPRPIEERNQLHVTNIDSQRVDDVAQWYAEAKKWQPAATAEAAAPAAPQGNPPANPPANPPPDQPPADAGPKGPGWIVRIAGHHYHNADRANQGAQYVRNTLIEGLQNGKIELPTGENGRTEEVAIKELGITYPVLINPLPVYDEEVVDPATQADSGGATRSMPQPGPGMGPGRPQPAAPTGSAETLRLKRFDFVVHLCWQPRTPSERQKAKKTQEQTTPAEPSP